MCAITDAIPVGWKNDSYTNKADVAHLFPGVDSPSLLQQIGGVKDTETLLYIPGALLSRTLRKHQSHSSLGKLVSTPLYRQMTMRNFNTARKIAEVCKPTRAEY